MFATEILLCEPKTSVTKRWGNWLHACLNDLESEAFEFAPFSQITPRSTMVIVCRVLWEAWRAATPPPNTSQHAFVGEHWVVEWTGEDKRHELDLELLTSTIPADTQAPLGIWFDCEGPKEDVLASPLAQAWNGIIRQPVIPWDKNERRSVLAHAYRELAQEVARWEAITATEATKQSQAEVDDDD